MIFGEDGKPYVIEIAARLSGGNFCYDKVPWSTGVDIVDILVDMAVGNPVDAARFVPTRSLATSQRYFFPAAGTIRQIDGVTAAKACRISARWMSGPGPVKPSRRRKIIPRGSAMSFPARPRARRR